MEIKGGLSKLFKQQSVTGNWPLTENLCLPFNSQDLNCNSPYCLPYSFLDLILENLVLDQLIKL